MTMRPDPTFHASPKLAMEAPPENFAYTLLLVPVSVTLALTGSVGWIYVSSALVLGSLFVREAWRLRSNDAPGAAMGVFRASIYYLAFIFMAVAADQLILR